MRTPPPVTNVRPGSQLIGGPPPGDRNGYFFNVATDRAFRLTFAFSAENQPGDSEKKVSVQQWNSDHYAERAFCRGMGDSFATSVALDPNPQFFPAHGGSDDSRWFAFADSKTPPDATGRVWIPGLHRTWSSHYDEFHKEWHFTFLFTCPTNQIASVTLSFPDG